jgi:hypothetical protein
MTAYNFTHTHTLSPDIAAKKAARKKEIERAHKLERNCYKAMMQRKCHLQLTVKDLFPQELKYLRWTFFQSVEKRTCVLLFRPR